ncbi:MAG: hypothetical protein IT566_14660 [Rhodospirillaceae bacterium]|nr:hypothetical protein [Rhodospirillaceae bacterium]
MEAARRIDPMEKYKELARLDPIREAMEAARRIDPMEKYKELARLDPIREAMEAARRFDPMEKYKELARLDPMREAMERIRRIDPLQKFIEHARFDPIREAMEVIRRNDPLKKYAYQLQSNSFQGQVAKITALTAARQLGGKGIGKHLRLQHDLVSLAAIEPAIIEGATGHLDALQEAKKSGSSAVSLTFISHLSAFIEYLENAVRSHEELIDRRRVLMLLWGLLPYIFSLWLDYGSTQQVNELGEKVDQHAADNSEEIAELRDHIDRKLDLLIELMAEANVDVQTTPTYIARRHAPVSPIQKFVGQELFFVPAGGEVVVVERAGKWIRIVFKDTTQAQTRQGWALKKYFQRVQ